MPLGSGEFWAKSQKWLKAGWLIVAGLVAIYVGVIEPRQSARYAEESRQTGLGAMAGDPAPLRHLLRTVATGDVGRVERQSGMMAYLATSDLPSAREDRKLIRTNSLDLIVRNPPESAENIRLLAERLGGFLTNSEVNGAQHALYASVSIRVPAARFEEARAEIRKLGLRVEGDRMEAQDVTRDYVDREARIRNLQAQEQQYLGILKRASTVKEMLEVGDKLNEVRGQIEQQQAEFETLSKQVETVAIAISLHAESDAQVFGLNWRPLYRLKMAARDGMEGLGDYAASMTAVLLFLPTILLWLMTILISAAGGWRLLRWVGRRFFGSQQTLATGKVANS